MTVLPLDPVANASPAALKDFLRGCQVSAVQFGAPVLVSISVTVDALDPLAVLESIFDPDEPHFYAERPDLETAIAGAETAAHFEATGPRRFAEVQDWIDAMIKRAIGVGEVSAPFGGPHFFAAFTFEDNIAPDAAFPAARVFVPRWQVARAGAVTTAVANLTVGPESDLAAEAERIWRAHEKFRNFDYHEFVGPSAGREHPISPTDRKSSSTSETRSGREVGNYIASVRSGLDRIAAGKMEKIVLARAKDFVSDEPWHPLRVLNRLRERFPDCYAFSLANGRGQSFFGASPERLVRVRQGVLETEALAGSAPRGGSAGADAALSARLLRDEKDLREHAHVVAEIVRRLQALGLTPEFANRPGLRRLANVQHLHTPIRASLGAEVRLLDVVGSLHPTPAVGGVPSAAAIAAIRELENFPRGLYAGALGWLNARGGGEFFVGLRSAWVDGHRARVYAGAGIVAGSVPEKEFAETELKFNAMTAALFAA